MNCVAFLVFILKVEVIYEMTQLVSLVSTIVSANNYTETRLPVYLISFHVLLHIMILVKIAGKRTEM